MRSIVKRCNKDGTIKYRFFVKGAPMEVFSLLNHNINLPKNYK